MNADAPVLLFFDMPKPLELIIILVVALLIFGRRLPDVARSIGRSIIEFKKGLRGVESEINQASSEEPKQIPAAPAADKQIPPAAPGEKPPAADAPAPTRQ